MCGICGVLYADPNRPVNPGLLEDMGRLLAHRGPDAEGFWNAAGIGLGHRRLSIIDLATGDQPMTTEDGSLRVVFNGEIYNYQSLRRELRARGHRFRTSSDTEVLLRLYEADGPDFVTRLRGMFAFALWDARHRRLLLGRDRFGIKPLYIYRDQDVLLFASEPKAFFAYPGIELAVDPIALDGYLAFGATCGTRSIFRKVEKLAPAHVLSVAADDFSPRAKRYWSLTPQADAPTTEDEWLEAVRAKVNEAVGLTLVADVPVGAFLSGGIDSGVVVATAARASGRQLQTFSIGFKNDPLTELPRARALSDRFGTRHTTDEVDADAVALLDKLTYFFDEPFADSSAIPTFLVSRLASRSVKVALSGDGGDEAFGGYTRYRHDLREDAIRRRLPRVVRRGIIARAARSWPHTDRLPRVFRAKTFLTNLSLDPAEAYANTLTTCRLPLRHQLLSPALRAAVTGQKVESPILDAFGPAKPRDHLAGMIAADIAVLLPDDYLVKVDRASMANGLEVRPPLLDHELLELTTAMPSTLKVRGSETKRLFRDAFRDLLPPETIDGPKRGFEVPLDRWLRGPLRDMFESSVLSPRAPVSELIDQTCAALVYDAHRRGGSRHGQTLWSLLVLARWAERYLHNASSNLARI